MKPHIFLLSLVILLSGCTRSEDELFLALTVSDYNQSQDCGIVAIQTHENSIPETWFSSTYIQDFSLESLVMDISPDGNLMAVAAKGADDFLEISLLDPNNVSTPPIIIDGSLGVKLRPSFSPDGKFLAYSFFTDSYTRVMLYDVVTSRIEVLIEQPSSKDDFQDKLVVISPDAWSPDGKTLAYLTATTDAYRLNLIDLETRNSWQIAEVPPDNDNFQISPYTYSWSSDGKLISINGGGGAYIVNADGSGFKKIEACGFYCTVFDWSPKGDGLLGINHDYGQLSVFYPDQTEKVFYQTTGRIQTPVWSPDGNEIVFFLVKEDDAGFSIIGLDMQTSTQTVYFSVDGNYDFDYTFPPKMVWYSGGGSSSLPIFHGISKAWFWLCGIGALLFLVFGIIFFLTSRKRAKVKITEQRQPGQKPQNKPPLIVSQNNNLKVVNNLPVEKERIREIRNLPPAIKPLEEGEFTEAIRYLRNKDYNKAIQGLAKLIQTDPKDKDAWLWLGSALAQAGHIEKARECVLRAKTLGAPNTERAIKWIDTLEKKS